MNEEDTKYGDGYEVNEDAQEQMLRDRCPVCDGTGRFKVREEDEECSITCPICVGKGFNKIFKAHKEWRMPRPRRRFPRSGDGRASILQHWPVWSRGSEEEFYPGREESERRAYAAARQAAEEPGDIEKEKEDESEGQDGRKGQLRADVLTGEPDVVTSYEIPVEVFGEVEINPEPEQTGFGSVAADAVRPPCGDSGGSVPHSPIDVLGSVVPPLATELNYDITGPGSLGIPYSTGNENLDIPGPAEGMV